MSAITHPTSTRRYDLDWLRVLAILLVFVFHTGRFFDMLDWHVKNPQTFYAMDVWSTFLANWMMPLIFVISGASTFYALGSRRVARFVKDRTLRLLVPLIVGIFSHIILQVYLERITHYQFRGSLFEFLPHYFDGFYAFGGNFAWMGLHLWYLEILFVFSLLMLPLFVWLKNGAGARLLAGLAGWLARPGAIYLLALPVAALLIWINPASPLGTRSFGGWSLPIYLLFFFYGFLLPADPGLTESLRRCRWVSLALALALTLLAFYLMRDPGDPRFGSLRYVLEYGVFGLAPWFWIVTFLGLGAQYLNVKHPFLNYANEAVLPFYVLHQTVLLAVGFYIVQWPIPGALKFVLIGTISFAIVIALYEFLVRRSNLLRFLFGMKTRPPAVVPLQETVVSS